MVVPHGVLTLAQRYAAKPLVAEQGLANSQRMSLEPEIGDGF
jgi:hypothetical protein